MTERVVKWNCDGCGTRFPKQMFSDGPDSYAIEIHPNVPDLCVCKGRDGGRPACVAKAIGKAFLCPGCGNEHPSGMRHIGQICNNCRALIFEARQAREGRDSVHVRIDRLELPSFYGVKVEGSYDASKEQDALVSDLMQALAPDRFAEWNPTDRDVEWLPAEGSQRTGRGGPLVSIEKKQLEPLRRFVDRLIKVFHEQRRVGRAEGGNLLLRLSRGEVSIDEYDVEAAKARGDKP